MQYARSVHSAQIPRPWSKYSAGSSANKEKERKKAPPEEDGEGERWIGAREAKKLAKQRVRELHDPRYKAEQLMKVDPKFREFMELMVPQKQRFWSDGFFENQDTLEQYKDTEKVLRDEGEAGSSDDEYQDIADSEEEEEEEEEERTRILNLILILSPIPVLVPIKWPWTRRFQTWITSSRNNRRGRMMHPTTDLSLTTRVVQTPPILMIAMMMRTTTPRRTKALTVIKTRKKRSRWCGGTRVKGRQRSRHGGSQ